MIKLKNLHLPFSPTILEFEIDMKFIKNLNKEFDSILKSKKLSKKYDNSSSLAGNVHKEVSLPMEYIQDKSKKFLSMIQTVCSQYMQKLPQQEGKKISLSDYSLTMTSCWAVSQFAGDFNPLHKHSGSLSSVLFLKMPPGFQKELSQEDHHISAGCLEFADGRFQDYVPGCFRVIPRVGTLYLFPSWLLHTVYPFRCSGERRSLSFNVTIQETK